MTDETTPNDTAGEALAQSILHPVKHAIIRVLTERGTASGREIAADISKPRSTVGDHLRKLLADGLIESAREEAKRGTAERFYRIPLSARWVEDDELAGMDAEERRRVALRVVRSAVIDASAAISTNTLDHRNDWCLSSTRVIVDADGWKELRDIHQRAIKEVERVRLESAERLGLGAGEKTQRVFSSLMMLELP
jgi:DNA-binding transcriptional ArsR family regulator